MDYKIKGRGGSGIAYMSLSTKTSCGALTYIHPSPLPGNLTEANIFNILSRGGWAMNLFATLLAPFYPSSIDACATVIFLLVLTLLSNYRPPLLLNPEYCRI